MEPITIVKKRSPVWMFLVVLIVLALIVAGALWFFGDAAPAQASELLPRGLRLAA